MDCPRCHGYVVEATEQDEEGEYCECRKCLNCGFRTYMQPVGKLIQVTKGQVYS